MILEYLNQVMEVSMWVIGRMTFSMGKERKLGRMEVFIRECTKMAKNMDKAFTTTQTEVRMMETGNQMK